MAEFPAVITGNYLPGKCSKFGQSGKYDIFELILLNIQSSFFKFNIKFKLIAYNCCPSQAYHTNEVMQWTTSDGLFLFHRL